MLEILQFKLDILWSMLDAMTMAYALQRPPYHTVTDKAAWAHDPTGVIMQKTSIVAFRRGYRLRWEAAQESHVILYPEGMAKLNRDRRGDPRAGRWPARRRGDYRHA